MTEIPRERVGVLLVHGIGEQKRFEHLEAEVRNIAAALARQGAKACRCGPISGPPTTTPQVPSATAPSWWR